MWREGKISRLYPQYCGSVHFGENTLSSALPMHLAECLRRVGAWDIVVVENRITCKANRVGTWENVLAPFGGADFEVDSVSREVRYRLRTTYVPISAAVVICFWGVFVLVTSFPMVIMAVFVLFTWMCILVAGMLLAFFRFTGFLHRSISSAPKISASPS